MSDPLHLRVARADWLSPRVRRLVLQAADGGALPQWHPGAHVDVDIPEVGRRSYSLCGDPTLPRTWELAVAREGTSRGGSAWLCERLKPGEALALHGPRNHFALPDHAGHTVFVAGGIGITPIRPMLHALSRRRRDWTLLLAARSRADAAFVEELQALAAAQGQAMQTSFGDDPQRRRFDLATWVANGVPGTHWVACGPAGLLAEFEAATAALPRAQVHLERFAADAPADTAGGYAVELARTGRRVVVPAGRTLLQALGDAGIDVPYACQEGVCGSCEVTVLDGVPEHRDLVLSPEEKAAGRSMMVCCSGSRSPRLVLDL